MTTLVAVAGLTRDEGIRPGSTVAKLAGLKPAFRPDGTITAGNASPLNDGACALVLGSERASDEIGRQPLARGKFPLRHQRPTFDGKLFACRRQGQTPRSSLNKPYAKALFQRSHSSA